MFIRQIQDVVKYCITAIENATEVEGHVQWLNCSTRGGGSPFLKASEYNLHPGFCKGVQPRLSKSDDLLSVTTHFSTAFKRPNDDSESH
jgi:hypothetical protein